MIQGEFSKKMFLDVESKGPQIIEYFVKYYGEQYRPIIEQKLSDLIVCFHNNEFGSTKAFKKAAIKSDKKNIFRIMTGTGTVGKTHKELEDYGKQKRDPLVEETRSLLREHINPLDPEYSKESLDYKIAGIGRLNSGKAFSFIQKDKTCKNAIVLTVFPNAGVSDKTIVHEMVHVLDSFMVPVEDFVDNDTISSNAEQYKEFYKKAGITHIRGNSFLPVDFVKQDNSITSRSDLNKEDRGLFGNYMQEKRKEWETANPGKSLDLLSDKEYQAWHSNVRAEFLESNPVYNTLEPLDDKLIRRSNFSEILTDYRADKILEMMEADGFEICGGERLKSGYEPKVEKFKAPLDLVDEQIKNLSVSFGTDALIPMVEVMGEEMFDIFMRGVSEGVYEPSACSEEQAQLFKKQGFITEEEYKQLIDFANEKLKERGKAPQEVDDVKMDF